MRISDWSSDVCSSDLAAERWLFADSMSTATPPEVQGEIITPPEDRLSLCAAALRQSALRRADSHCCPPWPIRKAGLRCTLIRISTRFPDRNIFERRSEEHTSELQSLMRNSTADFGLNKKKAS